MPVFNFYILGFNRIDYPDNIVLKFCKSPFVWIADGINKTPYLF